MAIDQSLDVREADVREQAPRPLAPVPVGLRIEATCRIVDIQRLDGQAHVHLVTVSAGHVGPRVLPPGTPLSLRFGSDAVADVATDGGAIAAEWHRTSAAVRVEACRGPEGFTHRLTHDGRAIGTPASAPDSASTP